MKFRVKLEASVQSFFWSTVGMSVSFIALMYLPHWTLCLPAICVCGAFDAVSEAHGLTLIQRFRANDPTLVTRLLGFWTSFQSAGVLLGCLVFGPVVQDKNFPAWVLVGHGIAIAACVITYFFRAQNQPEETALPLAN